MHLDLTCALVGPSSNARCMCAVTLSLQAIHTIDNNNRCACVSFPKVFSSLRLSMFSGEYFIAFFTPRKQTLWNENVGLSLSSIVSTPTNGNPMLEFGSCLEETAFLLSANVCGGKKQKIHVDFHFVVGKN